MKSENCSEILKCCSIQPMQPMPRCRTSKCTMDKLDQDFMLFLSFAFECVENLRHSKYLDNCKLWFKKLCSEHYDTVSSKRTRNLYLSRLLLNMQDGKFKPEFLEPPPCGQGFLPFCEIATCHRKPSVPSLPGCQFVNQGMDLTNFQHISQDRRTYVATKPVPSGVMGYVAVTMGGETPQWASKQGEPLTYPSSEPSFNVLTPGFRNYRLFIKQSRGNEEQILREKKKKILEKRKPTHERSKLIRFYDQILSRIDGEMEELLGKTCSENKDPFIEQLTKKLQHNLVSQSTDTVQNINKAVDKRKVLLAMLRSNIECQKKTIFEKREMILNKIKKYIKREESEVQSESGFQFIRPQENVYTSEIEFKATIWERILNEKMHPKHMTLLARNYCPKQVTKLVTMLQSLLKEEKIKIINQAKTLARNIEEQMMHDLQAEIQKGLIRFSNARQEWIKIQCVMEDIEKNRQELLREKMKCPCPTGGCTKQNLLETCAQVASMKAKLDCLNKRNEDLVKNIKLTHGKIYHVNEQNIACQEELNREYNQLKQCVTEKLNEIRDQEFAITKFKPCPPCRMR